MERKPLLNKCLDTLQYLKNWCKDKNFLLIFLKLFGRNGLYIKRYRICCKLSADATAYHSESRFLFACFSPRSMSIKRNKASCS